MSNIIYNNYVYLITQISTNKKWTNWFYIKKETT